MTHAEGGLNAIRYFRWMVKLNLLRDDLKDVNLRWKASLIAFLR
jgi:hypothetical protein